MRAFRVILGCCAALHGRFREDTGVKAGLKGRHTVVDIRTMYI